MPDVFYMAFRYAGPNGGKGVVTYYVDNVSWGRSDLPTITPSEPYLIDSLARPNVTRVVGTLRITGENLTEEINLSVEGNRYTDFSLSASTLPATGGEVTVAFLSALEGVHDAYLHLSSKGAADVYVPLAVLYRAAEGNADVQTDDAPCTKELRNGVLIIKRGKKEYTVMGKAL